MHFRAVFAVAYASNPISATQLLFAVSKDAHIAAPAFPIWMEEARLHFVSIKPHLTALDGLPIMESLAIPGVGVRELSRKAGIFSVTAPLDAILDVMRCEIFCCTAGKEPTKLLLRKLTPAAAHVSEVLQTIELNCSVPVIPITDTFLLAC